MTEARELAGRLAARRDVDVVLSLAGRTREPIQYPVPLRIGGFGGVSGLIDYIRVHVSQAGGLTPCRKMAAMGEAFGVKTAWHGPGDVSPIGHAANVALDLTCWNFGIQEWSGLDNPGGLGEQLSCLCQEI